MSFHTVTDYQSRDRLLRWLQERTAIRMESGADVWPFPELEQYSGDVIVRASSAGIAIVIPMGAKPSPATKVGRQVTAREFCVKIREKFPIIDETKTERQAPHQEQIQGLDDRRTP